MPSADNAARQVLVELELTSVIPARAFVPAITTNPPESGPPSGGASPADRWRAALRRASGDAEKWKLVREARAELSHLRRRTFPVGAWSDATDLADRILDGDGLKPEHVALALRCTPTMVRRTRLAHGRDADRGRLITGPLAPAALIDAGMSYRAVAAATGIPRSTLHDQIHRNP